MYKISTVKIFAILFFVSIVAQAQILNGDFEEWVNGVPVNWFIKDSEFCLSSATNIFQTTKAYSGNFAVYGKVISAADCEPSIRTYDNLENFTGFPISERPVNFSLQYIYKPTSEDGGGLSIEIYLMKGENVVGTGGGWIFNNDFLDTTYQEFSTSFSYYNDLIPDVIIISIGLVDNDVGSEFYVDDLSLSYMRLVSPYENNIIVSGEKEIIYWDSNSENINLKYSVDEDTSYISIINNYAADSSKYTWEVPKELLSTKGILRIEDSNDENNYHEISVKFKPWQLTRIDENGDFELYELSNNDWSFKQIAENIWPEDYWMKFDYSGTDPYTKEDYPSVYEFKFAKSNDFQDWPVFVKAFGKSQCYIGDYAAYKGRALDTWVAYKGKYNGSCFGLASTSLLYFYHLDYMEANYGSIGRPKNISNLTINDSIREMVHKYHALQLSETYMNNLISKQSLNARQTLEGLKFLLSLNNKDSGILSYFGTNPTGGHAVVPYKLERRNESSVFDLWVYDPNKDLGSEAKITFDSTANTWTDHTGIGWSDSNKCFINIHVNKLKDNLPLAKTNSKDKYLMESAISNNLKVFSNTSSDIIIKNSINEISYNNGSLTNSFADAIPIIPMTGIPQPPIGYYLPSDNYSIKLSNNSDSTTYLSVLSDSTIFNYRRFDTSPEESDILIYSNGFSTLNADSKTKNINLGLTIEGINEEKAFTLTSIDISEKDSLFINNIDTDNFIVKNYGKDKSYELRVRMADETGEKVFVHPDISQENNSAHKIIPDWDSLETNPIKILIDKGNDGSFDDSILVSNEITGIDNRIGAAKPNQIQLFQNYPNPFNPVTTIKYSIPLEVKRQKAEVRNVRLVVYDVLGREVATLVNQKQKAGNYEVEFNASGNGMELTSGIYFYKLQVGNYIETKKMILLK